MSVFVKVENDGTEEYLMTYVKNSSYYNEIKYFTDCLINNKPVEMCFPEDYANSVMVALSASKWA